MPTDDNHRASTGPEWRGRYVTAAQAAEFLSVHVRTVHRYAAEGRLMPYYLAGSRAVRFMREDVEGLLIPDGEIESDEEGEQ